MKVYKGGFGELLHFLNIIILDSCIMTDSEADEFASIEIIVIKQMWSYACYKKKKAFSLKALQFIPCLSLFRAI